MKKLLTLLLLFGPVVGYAGIKVDGSDGGSIGASVVSGTAGSVLFIDGSGNLGQRNARFYWDDSAFRLGLGLSNPASLLHLSSGTLWMDGTTPSLVVGGASAINSGQIEARAAATSLAAVSAVSGSSQARLFADSDSVGGISWITGGEFRFGDGSLDGGSFTDHLHILVSGSAGFIGINDTAPGEQLSIVSESAPTAYILSIASQTGTVGSILSVLGNGYVGISTTVPIAPLHIQKGDVGEPAADGNTALYLEGVGAVVQQFMGSTTSEEAIFFGDTAANGQGFVHYLHTGDFLKFGAAGAEQMRISGTGLGIGNTAPATKLHVSSGIATFDGTSPGITVGGHRVGMVEGSTDTSNYLTQFASAPVNGTFTVDFTDVGLKDYTIAPYVIVSEVFDSSGDNLLKCYAHTVTTTGLVLECVISSGDGAGQTTAQDATTRQVNYMLMGVSP